jgi:AraC-like DNA-binding protein
MSKIYNPSTKRYVNDNEVNRKKIETIAKQELFNIATEENKPKERRMIDNFWNTFIQPAITQEITAKNKVRKEQRKKILTLRANNKALEETLRKARTDVVKYKYTYSIRFYEEGDLYTLKGERRDGALEFETVNLKPVTNANKIIIASAVRLEQKMFKLEKNVTVRRRTGNVQISELHKAIDDTENQQFKTYYRNLTISDDSIVGMLVSRERVISYKPNFRFDANVLYNTENIGVVGTNNYFELDIDKANKCFKSNAIAPSDVHMACMYNVIMRLGVKINAKYSTALYVVSMESIARDCGVTERYVKGDFGMTINEALRWFKRYNISLSCYDIFYTRMFHWENDGKRNKHNLKACSVMVHN